MSPRQIIKNLADTPFSRDRLMVWALGVAVILSLVFIFTLSYQGKDIPPSLTMASGYVISSFTSNLDRSRK